MFGSQCPRFRALILAGGQSSRMGFPKYLLPMPVTTPGTSSQPLLLHLLDILGNMNKRNLQQFAECVTISVRDQAQGDELRDLLINAYASPVFTFEFVVDAVAEAGPAQGLLAAYNHDKTGHWLVLGCDYPLLEVDAVEQLVAAHQTLRKAVTCFQNSEGFIEPLLSIWSPSSLSVLADIAKSVSPAVGPNQAIKVLQRTGDESNDLAKVQEYGHGVELVQPLDANWIRSIDTKEQWEAIQDCLNHST